MIMQKITVLDPTVKTKKIKQLKLAVRADNIKGKVIGLLWNSKPNGDVLLDRLAQQLNERYHFTQIVKKSKPLASMPAPKDVLDDLSAKCDFVISAIAD